MQRRIERADSDRETVHGAEDTNKVGALHRQQLFEGGATVFFVLRKNHRAHVRQPVFGKKHMLGTAEANAFGPKSPCLYGIARNVSVGANAELTKWFGPAHDLDEFRIIRLGGDGAEAALDDAAGRTVE